MMMNIAELYVWLPGSIDSIEKNNGFPVKLSANFARLHKEEEGLESVHHSSVKIRHWNFNLHDVTSVSFNASHERELKITAIRYGNGQAPLLALLLTAGTVPVASSIQEQQSPQMYLSLEFVKARYHLRPYLHQDEIS